MAHMSRLINVENFRVDKDTGHPSVTLGGQEGSFAGTNLTGGRTIYTGISSNVRVLTYRYRGSPGAAPPPPPKGGR
jgi:hypothetical protein